MSENYGYLDENGQFVPADPPAQEPKQQWRRDLEQRAKEGDEAKRAMLDLQRELEFTKAGLPDTPLVAMFRKAYDGPMDSASIRKQATDMGLITPTASSGVEGEAAAHAAFSEAAAGGDNPPALTEAEVFRQARQAAESVPQHRRAEVIAEYLARHGQMPADATYAR